ncbi:MAG: 3-dehydroquinate synthase [Spirochaetales bacterium]|nr:3-dehydroquinate synthase [Spirochaetales bacterium]
MIQELRFQPDVKICKIYHCPEDTLLSAQGRKLVVFDTHTRGLLHTAFSEEEVVLPPGESEKTLASVEKILRHAVKTNLSRDSFLIGFGGGVICDMAALAASLYMRGCRLILIPTTLLAMVDAAVGGKTGVDFEGYKNLTGSFYPAEEIRIHTGLLDTLPEGEYITGLAEVIKYAFLGEEGLLRLLENRRKDVLDRKPEVLKEIIDRSVVIKSGYITRDPEEKGIRGHLNLGHTFAHALESSQGFGSWTHGRAVAWGMIQALRLGRRLGITDPAYLQRAKDLLQSYGFDVDFRVPPDKLEDFLQALKHDKKNRAGELRVVLQRGPEETFFQAVRLAEIQEILTSQE